MISFHKMFADRLEFLPALRTCFTAVGHFLRLTSSPSLTRKSLELICIAILSTWLLPRSDQRLEAGDHVEKLLVDAALAQLVEGAVKLLQQVVDVLVGALHCRQAARVLAGQRFRASPEQRDEKIFAD